MRHNKSNSLRKNFFFFILFLGGREKKIIPYWNFPKDLTGWMEKVVPREKGRTDGFLFREPAWFSREFPWKHRSFFFFAGKFSNLTGHVNRMPELLLPPRQKLWLNEWSDFRSPSPETDRFDASNGRLHTVFCTFAFAHQPYGFTLFMQSPLQSAPRNAVNESAPMSLPRVKISIPNLILFFLLKTDGNGVAHAARASRQKKIWKEQSFL